MVLENILQYIITLVPVSRALVNEGINHCNLVLAFLIATTEG